jgi:hypothetical protein
MNKQEIFDKAYIGIIKQGKPSMSASGQCKYEAKDGCRCAVGMLIDDASLRKSMDAFESSGILDIVAKARSDDEDSKTDLKLPDWIIEEEELLHTIQCAHDFAGQELLTDEGKEKVEFIPEFKSRMKAAAKHHGLTVPEVN